MEEIIEMASKAKAALLPTKSKQIYEETYNAYKKWCIKKQINVTTEDSVLAYFSSDLALYKSSSLWCKYSMLRTTINLNEGIDISKFPSLIPYLKRKGEGYTVKKSLILSKENVDSFLLSADDKLHLLNKVILIFGISGACRRQELAFLSTTDVEDHEKHFVVRLTDTKTGKNRNFVIISVENFKLLETIRKYIALRPKITPHKRFFVNYCKEKCTVQPVGIHKIGSVPSQVAKFLNLPNSGSYTGHCFRRTSASLLANSGGSMNDIMRHGGWRSATVAEGYVEESESRKINVATKILAQSGPSSGVVEAAAVEKTEMQDNNSEPISISNNVNCVIKVKYCNH